MLFSFQSRISLNSCPCLSVAHSHCCIFRRQLYSNSHAAQRQFAQLKPTVRRWICQAADQHYSERRTCSIHHLFFFSLSFTLFLHTMLRHGADCQFLFFNRTLCSARKQIIRRAAQDCSVSRQRSSTQSLAEWLTVVSLLCLSFLLISDSSEPRQII